MGNKGGSLQYVARGFAVALMVVSFLLWLSGCSAFVDQDQPHVELGSSVTLAPDHPVGQTFVARHAGLNGVEIWLEPEQNSQGQILLHLRNDPHSLDELTTAALSLVQIPGPGFYRFTFPPLSHSYGRYLYAFLELRGNGSVQVGAGSGDIYLDGALYRGHQPLDAQMAFRLVYDPWYTMLDLARAAVGGLGLLGVAGLLYVVPGWALLAWLWPENQLSWAERLGLAAGLSLALYPLLMLWTDLVGLHLGSWYAWFPVASGLVALAWRYRAWRPRKGWEVLLQWMRSQSLWPDLSLLVIMGLVIGVRLLAVRSIDAPMWGDSYQHTMIAQLMVDHGGLFDSWEPYASLQNFTYHFGFHTAMSVFHWLTGMQMLQTVLWGAQILNALSVLALYPLAVRVSGNRWAGVLAVLLAGLLSPMPMYYVNWGRYTQLAGQAILPAAVVLSWAVLEAPRRERHLVLLSWIAVGGLALTHYRVLVFYVFFVLAWAVLYTSKAYWQRSLSRMSLLGVGAGTLGLPWFVHAFSGRIVHNLGRQLTTKPEQLSAFARQYNAIGDLTLYLAPGAWLMLLMAVAIGLWQHRHKVLLVVLWWGLLFIVANPEWFHLPGSGVVSNFALFIAAYIPAGVLIGDLLGHLAVWLGCWRMSGIGAIFLMVTVGLLGTRARMAEVLPFSHTIITRPDLRAMAWIRKNTAEDSRFLVNSFFAYGGRVIVGSDGGWWLPLLAGRSNTVPPLNYSMEQAPWTEYRQQVEGLARHIQGARLDDPATLALLQEQGITHVYIGQRQGRTNYTGPDVLDYKELLHSDQYHLVYHRDRVWVFEVNGDAGKDVQSCSVASTE